MRGALHAHAISSRVFPRLNLNDYLDPPIFDPHFVGFNIITGVVEAGAGAQVEAPVVPVAFDGVGAEASVGERCAFVWAEVFDGVEFAADVVECEFPATFQLDGRAASRRQVVNSPDCHFASFAWRALEVAELFLE